MLLTDYQTHRAVFKDREQTLPASPADAVFKEVKTDRHTDRENENKRHPGFSRPHRGVQLIDYANRNLN